MDNIINNIIAGYAYYSVLYKDDPVKLMYFLKNGFPRKTLGGILEYFHPSASKTKYNSLSNFHYVGGILLTDVILGFDFDKKKYITDPDSLSEQSVIKLDTPLLNTQLYRRFLDSGKEPIVLKTMAFYDGFTGEYQKFQLGKFGNQVGMHRFTYALTTSGSFPTSKIGDDYYNSLVGYRPSIVVEYCYYDGNNWIEETETIGGNDESWYTSYTDTLGNKILQHKFDIPNIFLGYTKPYVLSLKGGRLMWDWFRAIVRVAETSWGIMTKPVVYVATEIVKNVTDDKTAHQIADAAGNPISASLDALDKA